MPGTWPNRAAACGPGVHRRCDPLRRRRSTLIPKCPLLENFSHGEVRLLAHFMEVYRALAGVEMIREGEGGDFC
jgi:hypothetical protein